MQATPIRFVFPFLISGLILGIAGGWVRLGFLDWYVPGTASEHGLLLVGGFMGTLICVEVVSARTHESWLVVPFLSGCSIPVLLVPGWSNFGHYMLLLASVGLVALHYQQTVRNPVASRVMGLVGSASWLLGNFMVVSTGFVAAAVPWWMAFLLFAILAQLLNAASAKPRTGPTVTMAYLFSAAFIAGVWLPFHGAGAWLMGLSVSGIACSLLWLQRRHAGDRFRDLCGYSHISLVTGFLWLFTNGLVLCFAGQHPWYYDLYIHSFFLGFVFSVVWAHAPIVLPKVLGLHGVPYHWSIWIVWVLFQGSLSGRVLSSLLGNSEWRTCYGVLNGWTILAMFAWLASLMVLRTTKSGVAVKPANSAS